MVTITQKSQADVRKAIANFNYRLEDAWNKVTNQFYFAPRADNSRAWEDMIESKPDVRSKIDALYYSSPRLTTLKTTRKRAVAVANLKHDLTNAWAAAVINLIDGVYAESESLIRDKAEALPEDKIRELKKAAAIAARESDPSFATLRAAIEPQRADYTQKIFEYLRREVDVTLALLAKFNGDAQLAAPYPEGRLGRVQYAMAKRLYDEVRKWSTVDTTRQPRFSRGLNDPDYRLPKSDDVINAALMSEANAITDNDFTSYATKLAGKIANGRNGVTIVEAAVIGGLWTHSTLKATAHVLDETSSACEGFNVENHVWTTNMIINRSSLGTLFNQWPTRKC